MKRIGVIVGALVVAAPVAFAATDPRLAGVREQASRMGEAMVRGDDTVMADMTYSKVVEMNGGREKMLAAIATSRKAMAADGTSFAKVEIGEPGAAIAGGSSLFTVIPETLTLTVKGGRLLQESFLLGISSDNGATWTFLDGAGLARFPDKIPELLPDLPTGTALPTVTRPVFVPAN